jgi:hypothetical protein
VAGERNAILLLATDAPILGGDLGMLAHAHAGRPVGHGGHIEAHVAQPEIGDVAHFLAERAGLLEFAQPVGERLAEADLDTAETVDATHQSQGAVHAVDHAGCLERAGHAGRAGHDRGEGRHRRIDAGIHQHLAGDVAPGQVGHDAAPDGEVRLAAFQEADHGAHHGHRERNGVVCAQRAIDFGEGCADTGSKPDVGFTRSGFGHSIRSPQ